MRCVCVWCGVVGRGGAGGWWAKGMRVGVDTSHGGKYRIHIPLPPKIDPTVTMMTGIHQSLRRYQSLPDRKTTPHSLWERSLLCMFILWRLVVPPLERVSDTGRGSRCASERKHLGF